MRMKTSDDDDAALELLDRGRERVDRRHVQEIRRLVCAWAVRHPVPFHTSGALTEEEDMRMLHRQLRKHHSVPETIRQLLDGRRLVRARETKAAELRAPRLEVLVRELLVVERLEVLDRRLVVRQLVRRMLRVLGQLEVDVP